MYEFHELAAIVPLSSEKELEALKYDISVNGQIEKAIVWQNKIIDGRNRSMACKALGIDLKVEILDDNMPYEEVFSLVMSKNNRRSLSPTQKAISAFNSYKELKQLKKRATVPSVAMMWGISSSVLDAVIFIAKHQPEYIDILFNGNKVKVGNVATGEFVTTNSIVTLYRVVRSNIKNGIVPHSEYVTKTRNHSDAEFVNEQAYEWFVENSSLIKDDSRKLESILVEYANMRFGSTQYKKMVGVNPNHNNVPIS